MDIERLGIFSILILVLPVFSVLRRKLAMIAKTKQRIEVPVCTENNISAATAVTTLRAAFWHKFLMAERRFPMTAVSCLHRNLCTVNKLHMSPYIRSCFRKCCTSLVKTASKRACTYKVQASVIAKIKQRFPRADTH